MIPDTHKTIVQNSFGMIASESTMIGVRFYNHLFEVAPQYQSLFTIEMDIQRQKFFQMLGILVAALHDINQLTEIMHALGKRHALYGVKTEDYEIVREALLWAIDSVLGVRFTPEMRAAWEAIYNELAQMAIITIED